MKTTVVWNSDGKTTALIEGPIDPRAIEHKELSDISSEAAKTNATKKTPRVAA